MLEIRKVQRSEDLEAFLLLPFRIYAEDPLWVPPLLWEERRLLTKGAFLRHGEAEYFLAFCEGEAVGRISCHVDFLYNQFHKTKVGFFGFLEFVKDKEVAQKLLEVALEFGRKRGLSKILGPFNFTTNYECGLLVEGFDTPPMVMMLHHPPYYQELIEEAGWKKAMDLLAYRREARDPLPRKWQRLVERLEQRRDIQVRKVNVWRWKREVAKIKQIYQESWEANWGFAPLTEEELEEIAWRFRPLVKSELAFIAEVKGEPAGFSLTIPNANEPLLRARGRKFPFLHLLWDLFLGNFESCRLILMGVRKKFRNLGLPAVFCYRTLENATKLGFKWGELSWVLENNVEMRRIIESAGAVVYKRYRIYEKNV